MDENKFWLNLWVIFSIIIIGVICVFAVYYTNDDKVFMELIDKHPEHAIELACARDAMTSQSSTVCVIYLSKMGFGR